MILDFLKSPCEKCDVEAECAANDWRLFNADYKKCPNRKEGLKQYKKFLKEYLAGKYDC